MFYDALSSAHDLAVLLRATRKKVADGVFLWGRDVWSSKIFLYTISSISLYSDRVSFIFCHVKNGFRWLFYWQLSLTRKKKNL